MAKKIIYKKYKTGNKPGGQRYHVGRKRNMRAYTDAYKGRMIPPFKHMDYMDFKSSPQNYGTAFTRFPYMGKRRYGMGTQEAMMKIVKAKSPEELMNIDIATIPSEEGQKEITKLIREKQRSFGMRPHMDFDPTITEEFRKSVMAVTKGERKLPTGEWRTITPKKEIGKAARQYYNTPKEEQRKIIREYSGVPKKEQSTRELLEELGIERAD